MTESKILLVLDKKDYEDGMPVFERKCVRAIIEKNGKIAVQRGKGGDCKILGGGMVVRKILKRHFPEKY